MVGRVARYIERHSLLDKEKIHLVALSGGADSVCLLLILKELGYDIHAVHCNFRLRGEESDRDENFCKALCKKNGIELHLTHFDTKSYAEMHKVSIEMAARDLRYAYFEQLRVAINAEDIVVAHHRDDNVETFLMNVIRGTGIHGLEAIKPRNGRIIRPLLCVTRREIEDFLVLKQQDYVTDSSNLVDDVVRNKIRLNLIPLLESINPAVRDNINKTIENVSEAARIVDACEEKDVARVMKKTESCWKIDVKELLTMPSPEYVLFSILSKYGFSSSQIRQIFENIDAPSGRVWTSVEYLVATDRNALLVVKKDFLKDFDKCLKIPEPAIYIYNEHVRISINIDTRNEGFVPSKDPYVVTMDSDKVRFPIIVRKVQEGDRFKPFGMRGTKLVSDYLTDKKRNFIERQRQLVVQDAEGKIVWLVGERTSQLVACDSNTIKILTLRYLIDEE